MSHETPWDLVAKILAWNSRYASEAATAAARRRLLTDAHAAAAAEIRRRDDELPDSLTESPLSEVQRYDQRQGSAVAAHLRR